MYCRHENKEIGRPLETHDGGWYCPECLKSLFPEFTVELNVESSVKYFKSERLFHEDWLLGDRENQKDAADAALAEALQLCREAAYEKNPYAALAMGYYYDRKYFYPELSEFESAKNALKWYNMIAVHSEQYRDAFKGLRGIASFKAAKGETAKALPALSRTAMENVYRLMTGVSDITEARLARTEFQREPGEVIKSLEHILGLKRSEVNTYIADGDGIITESLADRLSSGEILFGVQKAGREAIDELNRLGADEDWPIRKPFKGYRIWLAYCVADGSPESMLLSKASDFKLFYQEKAAEQNGGEFFLAYFKDKAKTVFKTPVKTYRVRGYDAECFKANIRTFIRTEAFYDIKTADIIIGSREYGKSDFDGLIEHICGGNE